MIPMQPPTKRTDRATHELANAIATALKENRSYLAPGDELFRSPRNVNAILSSSTQAATKTELYRSWKGPELDRVCITKTMFGSYMFNFFADTERVFHCYTNAEKPTDELALMGEGLMLILNSNRINK